MLEVVDRKHWLAARTELLEAEKELTRLRDRLAERRRALPLVEVRKNYWFSGLDGPVSMLDLFEGRRQLIVFHFAFSPEWDEGCKRCSFIADNVDGWLEHLWARDTGFVAISRAPIGMLQAFRRQQGWRFPWVSCAANSFNDDFEVTIPSPDDCSGQADRDVVPLNHAGSRFAEDVPGVSVFLRDGERILHSYSAFDRGLDDLINTYSFLDLTPLGRQEEGLPWPMSWIEYRSDYPRARASAPCYAHLAYG